MNGLGTVVGLFVFVALIVVVWVFYSEETGGFSRINRHYAVGILSGVVSACVLHFSIEHQEPPLAILSICLAGLSLFYMEDKNRKKHTKGSNTVRR